MANYNTAIKGYLQGTIQIENFVRKEIGTQKESEAIIHKYRVAAKKAYNSLSQKQKESPAAKRKLEAAQKLASEKAKSKHHMLYGRFNEYSRNLFKFLNNGEVIGKETVNQLININENVQNMTFFDTSSLKWESEAGVKAIKKYSDMMLKNDRKKLEYYRDCLNKTDKPIKLEDVLNCPTPVMKKATEKDIIDFAKKIKELEDKLSKTESFLHTNSPEYNAMKAAMKSVNQGLAKGINAEELGSRLDVLQTASMEYVKAKGVGMQSTQRGKDRMDAVLDLCSLSADAMDFYTSKERRQELENFEKEQFDKVLSEEIKNKYIDPVSEVFKEKVYHKEEMEIDALTNDGFSIKHAQYS